MRQRYTRRKRRPAGFLFLTILGLAAMLPGCGKKEEAVVFVEEAPKEETQLIDEEEWEDESGISSVETKAGEQPEPGAVLGEETIFLYQGEEGQQMILQRIQGSFGYSLAYTADAYKFCLAEPGAQNTSGEEPWGETGDLLVPVEYGTEPENSPVRMTIAENMDYALEELADEIVFTCEEECLVEEIWIGEEEYPATWITYTEETETGTFQVDYYLTGFETHVFVIKMVCPLDDLGSWGEDQQLILSTLRFDSGAEG